jgi:glycosyltransferase involved in cell wall biosynthesis
MKLLVLAQTPPPVHGQSLMVQTMVDGLPAHGVAVHHVNLLLARDAADIGRWRPGKFLSVAAACVRTVAARIRHGCDTLYYVPAPGKRGALYRDWVVMVFCRPFFKRLVLHWHAYGLADWLNTRARAPERRLTHWLLGRADLSIVLADALRADAAALHARRIAVVPNGIADPCPDWQPRVRPVDAPFQVLFLGLCSEEKGLFNAAAAVLAANREAGANRFQLTAAGEFPDRATAQRFQALAAGQPEIIRHVGAVRDEAKHALLTRYPHEGQPLVLLEALAHDLPVIATDWRAIPSTVPAGTPLVPPDNIPALGGALQRLRVNPPASGRGRAHFLAHFTAGHHLTIFAAALRTLA